MITIFSATNRPDSNTFNIARNYASAFEAKGVEVQIYSLVNLPDAFLINAQYGHPPKGFEQVINDYILNVEKFVFIAPEYNGSFPGILKLFLDTLPPAIWTGKKAALVGLADGRSGNLRGLDQLMTVLNYLKVEVYSYKPVFSQISTNLTEEGKFGNREYISLMERQIQGLLEF